MSAARGDNRRRIAAVIVREMRALARYRTPFVLRTVYGALIAMPVVMMLSNNSRQWNGADLANLGYQAFTILVWFQSFLALALGGLMGVVSIVVERRERTLGLVMLSPVKPAELVLGKLTALMALLSTVLLAGLPVYALVGWAGGVDYLWFACLVLLSVALAVLGIAAGLVGGLIVRNGFGAVLCTGVLLFGPMIAGVIALETTSDNTPDLTARVFAGALWLASTVAFQGGDDSIASAFDIVTMAAMIGALLLYAIQILPRAATAREGKGLRGIFENLDRFFERINFGGIRFGQEGRSLTGDPVSWLTRTTSGTALVRYSFRLAAAMLIVALVSIVLLLFDDWISLSWVFFGAALILTMLALGATGLGDEKARRSLQVLLATPLTAAQILHGKMRAALPAALAVSIPAVVFIAFSWLLEPRHFDEVTAVGGAIFVEGLCGYFLALYLSLHMASSLRAGVAAALVLAAIHVLFSLVMAMSDKSFSSAISLSLIAIAVSCWPQQGRKKAVRAAALLFALVTGVAALWPRFDVSLLFDEMSAIFFVLLPATSVLAYLQTRRDFDRVLGRTP